MANGWHSGQVQAQTDTCDGAMLFPAVLRALGYRGTYLWTDYFMGQPAFTLDIMLGELLISNREIVFI